MNKHYQESQRFFSVIKATAILTIIIIIITIAIIIIYTFIIGCISLENLFSAKTQWPMAGVDLMLIRSQLNAYTAGLFCGLNSK